MRSPLTLAAAEANVNRTWAFAGTAMAIFTFTLVFLYPRFSTGAIDPVLFQISLAVIGLAIFSFVFSMISYYTHTLALSLAIGKAERFGQRGEEFWLVGFSLLLLEPSLILFSVGLVVVGLVLLALWIAYFIFAVYAFTITRSWSRQAK